ncbi:hypothetical protein WMO66_12550 [Faecousia sp. CLA-AA-H192]|uniref:Ankyrin repeat protein n=1 Tax=Faecousia intestinalis TaxID=3133167 RepID=A0ABV1G9G8_9FIRM
MTLEELKRLAEQGDTEAMIEISDRVYDKDSYEKIAEATSWDLRAAEAGSLAGIMRSITGCTLLAVINLLPNIKDWKEALLYSQQTLRWCDVALKEVRLDQDDLKMVTDSRNDCQYYCGVCHYYQDNYDETVRTLYGLQQTHAYALYGVCMYALGSRDIEHRSSARDDLKTAYQFLSYVERDSAYITSDKEYYEDAILSFAAYELSCCYRIGLPGTLNPDLERSVRIMSFVLPNLKYDFSKPLLQKELAKYKKKMLGGYKYIG